MTIHRKICTYALSGLLTLGIAAGAAFAQDNTAPQPQSPPMRGYYRANPDMQLQHMTTMLDLTTDQQSKIKPILESRHNQMQAVWQDQSLTQPDRRQKMMAIQNVTSKQIEAILNDTQKQKYEAMLATMREGRMGQGMGQGNMPPPNSKSPQPQSSPMRGYRRANPDMQLQHMTTMFDLTADQQSKIKPILDARHKQMQAVWQDQSLTQQDRRQKMMAIQQEYSGKIKAVLNETQKKKYEEMQAYMRDGTMRRGMGQGMGPGMGPGNMPPPDSTSPPPQQ
jgi:periplasmic protein CpxP/Spy